MYLRTVPALRGVRDTELHHFVPVGTMRHLRGLLSWLCPAMRNVRVPELHHGVSVGHLRQSGRVRGGRDPSLRKLRVSDLPLDLLLGALQRGRRLRRGSDPALRDVRDPDLRIDLLLGYMLWPRGVFRRADPHHGLRPVQPPGLRNHLPLGVLHTALGRRVRAPLGHQQPRVQRVPLRAAMVPRHLPVEFQLHLVLHLVRRLPVGSVPVRCSTPTVRFPVFVLVALGCSTPAAPSAMDAGTVRDAGVARSRGDVGPSPYRLDGVLRLNHVQARGTHNSYHLEPASPLDPSHRYSHEALDVQLERYGVRQFELDVHYREDVGFEVFHLPRIDDQTSCRRFTECLAVIRRWSDAHPWHLPLVIWIEPKDEAADFLDNTLLPIAGRYGELEADILAVWPRSLIFAPDDLRGSHPDLPTAVRSDGWPTLGRLRGKVIFAMLDDARHRARYLEGASNLAGRLMFVDATSSRDPFAAMFKINDAAAGAEMVRGLVREGFIVTSNVGGAGATDAVNRASLEASLASGMHFGSTDFPAPRDGGLFWFELDGGSPARCNPVFPAGQCTSDDLERLR